MATHPDEVTDYGKFTSLQSSGVASDVVVIAPADGAGVQTGGPWRAIRANVAGVVAVYTPGSPAVARLLNFGAGETRYFACTRVLLTGTTATGIEGMT